MKSFLYILFFFFSASISHGQNITTIAGNGTMGFAGDYGASTLARVAQPRDVQVDDSGNLYIADIGNLCIRKINAAGIITTVAGVGGSSGYSGDNGPAVAARLMGPTSIALDRAGNLYIMDESVAVVRKVNAAGIITTIAGSGTHGFGGDNGPATLAQLDHPCGVTVDKHGNVYICDTENNRIRKIDATGVITTIAGTGVAGTGGDGGPATAAEIIRPLKISVDTSGNTYFSSDWRVRKINAAGIISTVAGTGFSGALGDGGPATAATVSSEGLKVDNDGNIYLTDPSNNSVRWINSSGLINTIVGTGFAGFSGDNGPALLAELSFPVGVTVDNSGYLYIADAGNNRIRKTYEHTESVCKLATYGSVIISPNPSNGRLSVSFSTMQDRVELLVTDIVGREIKKVNSIQTKQENITIDQPDGVYFLKITTPAGTATRQLIVHH